jgi:hypothetical protein
MRVRSLLADIPDEMKAEATVMFAECCLEVSNQKIPEHWDQPPPRQFALWRDEAEKIAGGFIPPGVDGPLPQQIRDIVNQLLMIFIPRDRVARQGRLPENGVSGAGSGVIQVINVEAQERAERFITLTGGTRVLRTPDDTVAWMYPHFWVDYIKTKGSAELAVSEWSRQISEYFRAGHSVLPELHQETWNRLTMQQKIWLRSGHGDTLQTTTAEQVKTFLNNTELLLQLFLICRKATTASHTAMTQKFWSLISANWAKGEPIDYLKAVSEARELKDSSFRPHRQ